MNCAYASSFDCFCCCCWACWKGPAWCCGCCGGLKTSVMGSLCRCFFASFTFVGTKRVTSVRRFLKMSPAHLTICGVRTRARKFPPPQPPLITSALLGISGEDIDSNFTQLSRRTSESRINHQKVTCAQGSRAAFDADCVPPTISLPRRKVLLRSAECALVCYRSTAAMAVTLLTSSAASPRSRRSRWTKASPAPPLLLSLPPPCPQSPQRPRPGPWPRD